MTKHWKVYNGYNGMDGTDYTSLADAQDAAKILANENKNNRKYPTTILEVVAYVKVPVPELEIVTL
jgi:hypothetical protein